MLAEYPSLSRLGVQAKLIMGGGPHMRISVSSPGGYRCSEIISALTKPLLYFHPGQTQPHQEH